jgi:hypothetical protein
MGILRINEDYGGRLSGGLRSGVIVEKNAWTSISCIIRKTLWRLPFLFDQFVK